MMNDRIEEFVRHGKRYAYFDLSCFKTNEEFRTFVEMAKPVVEKYKKLSLYTIANVDNIRFDSETKEILAEWMKHNEPYVKQCVVIGMNGIKKIMLGAVLAISRRENVAIAASKDQAIEMLKLKEWEKWENWGQV